jgi:hypothetical protein
MESSVADDNTIGDLLAQRVLATVAIKGFEKCPHHSPGQPRRYNPLCTNCSNSFFVSISYLLDSGKNIRHRVR